jgi:hypothetical protein
MRQTFVLLSTLFHVPSRKMASRFFLLLRARKIRLTAALLRGAVQHPDKGDQAQTGYNCDCKADPVRNSLEDAEHFHDCMLRATSPIQSSRSNQEVTSDLGTV